MNHKGRRDRSAAAPLRRSLLSTPLVPLVILGLMLVLASPGEVDDAYISYRYAENLLNGHGLVMNAGERVEGISNPLWTLLLAVLHAIGLSYPVASFLLGALSLAATVVLTHRLARRLGMDDQVATAIAAGVAGTIPFVASATMGLEGGLYAALLLASLLTWPAQGLGLLGLAAATAGLAATRPEGLGLAVLLGVVHLLVPGRRLLDRAVSAAVPLGVVLAIEALRYAYYGEWVPNSVTAKRDIGVSLLGSLRGNLPDGGRYLVDVAGPQIAVAVAVVTWAGIMLRRHGHLREALVTSPTLLLPALALLAAGFALPLVSGGDWMPNGRLLTPYFPIGYCVVTFVTFVALRSSRVHRRAIAMALPLTLAAISLAQLPTDMVSLQIDSEAPFDDFGRAIGRAGLEERVIATNTLGRMSFYASDNYILDSLGLTEPAIAQTLGWGSVYGKWNYEYVIDQNPAVIVTNTWPELELADEAASGGYSALIGENLTDGRIFVLVDEEGAEKLVPALGRDAVQVVSVEEAFDYWRVALPDGF